MSLKILTLLLRCKSTIMVPPIFTLFRPRYGVGQADGRKLLAVVVAYILTWDLTVTDDQIVAVDSIWPDFRIEATLRIHEESSNSELASKLCQICEDDRNTLILFSI